MTHTTRSALGLVATACVSASAAAQHADLFIMHDDPDGIVSPGQTVRMEIRMAWSGAGQVASLRGDVTSSHDVGTASSPAGPSPGSYFMPWQSSLGTPAGGGLTDIGIEFIWVGFTGGWAMPCVSGCAYVECGTWLSWDWTAPAVSAPTPVDIDFVPRAGETGMQGYALQNPFPLPMSLDVHAATLVVTPAPAASIPLALALAWPASRRRRP